MVTDRRISQRYSNNAVAVIDEESNKLVVVQCRGIQHDRLTLPADL
jgi:hypothetical protein